MKLFQRHAKQASAKGFQQSGSPESQSSFLLEPILTPSVGIDGTEGTPEMAIAQIPDTSLPNIHLPDVDSIPQTVDVLHPDHSLDLNSSNLETVSFINTLGTLDFSSHAGFDSGVFNVGTSGEVSVDYLFDGGGFEGELAMFSLDGMEQLEPGSDAFIQEAARRALSNSPLGHVVISDATDAARFSGSFAWEGNLNAGDYQGVQTFQMRSGDRLGFMLVPNDTVQSVLCNHGTRPLFSMATSNPDNWFQSGQIADVTGDGNTFVFEDLRLDGHSDRDYNDIIFQVRGATAEAVHLDDVIDANHDWRSSDMGHALLDYSKAYVETINPSPIHLQVPVNQQPLIGVIDTGFANNNPDIDYSRLILGRDLVSNDDNPLLQPGEDGEHGTHILGIIGATQDNNIGIDGANDDAPLWVGRAIGSGQWADSLTEFVDAAKESGQPNAVVNLSFDLTQLNPDGTITTRYELTPHEWAALEYAHQNHVLVVAAAGNDGGVMSALGQASQMFDNVITIGSAHSNNASASPAIAFERADYSNFGYGLDLVADGGTTDAPALSTVGDATGTMAGTSVAVARVTGAISQVWAANPDLSYREVIDILKATATDLKTPGWDLETGAGLLNMAAAVGLAKSTQPQVYESELTNIPPTWSGEGLVIPLERASLTLEEQKIIGALRTAIIGQESGYNYKAVNAQSGALGFAQVMPANVGPWSREALGYSITTQQFLDNPALQLKIIDYKLAQYWQSAIAASGGDRDIAVRRVASAWYSGDPNLYTSTRPQYYNGVEYPSIAQYTLSVLGKFNQAFGSGSIQPPVTSTSGRVYTIQSGDTLWALAQRYLGDGNRWREITKEDGSAFTQADVRTLRIGSKVLLPIKNQVGTGNPTIGTPFANPTPINSQIGRGSRSPQLFQEAFIRIDGNRRGLTPTGDAYRWGNGWTQEFRDAKGDRFLLMLADNANKAFLMQYANLGEYDRMGGALGKMLDGRWVNLGYPTTDEIQIPRADGKWAVWQGFSDWDGKARIHYLDGVGSIATWGLIGVLYTDMGGAGSWLGMPTRAEYIDGDTIWADFQGGKVAHNRNTGKTEALRPGELPSWRQPVPPPLPPVLTAQEFKANWRNWQEYTLPLNPFPAKGANCTWYAHGRMLQLGYSEYALDSMLGNAGMWDNTATRGASVTFQPQVPCIAVWEANVGGAGSVGHVAVVERINSDGSILISESNWPTGTTYGTRTIYPGSKWPSKFITVPKA